MKNYEIQTKVINKVTDLGYIQWIEKFVRDVIKQANINCKEIIIEDIENSKRVFLTIDGKEYDVRTWNFDIVDTDSNGIPCAEIVDYTLYEMVVDVGGSHGQIIDCGKIRIEWKNERDKEV